MNFVKLTDPNNPLLNLNLKSPNQCSTAAENHQFPVNLPSPLGKVLFDDAVCFDQIKAEHFIPALKEAIEFGRKELLAIEKNANPPSFQNTIEALETSGEWCDRILTIYSNLESAVGDESLRSLAQEIYPMATDFNSDILLNKIIFERVLSVYNQKSELQLNIEEKQLLEKTYKSFARNGALLTEEQKNKLRQIDQELSVLAPKFSENVLLSTNNFELCLEKKEDLQGLPESAIEAAKTLAIQKNRPDSWVFTLQAPSYVPFLTYAARRSLREKMWKAYNARGYAGDLNNRELIKKIVSLRHQRALLLGFENHAAFILEERMAKKPETVKTFISQLMTPFKAAAEKDLIETQNLFKFDTGEESIQPWDWAYYSEKLKQQKFEFHEEDLRPYFELDRAVSGAFELAKRLFGVEFNKLQDIPTYHQDVVVYKVTETHTNKYIGLLYADFFPRDTKRGGAWMTNYREQGLLFGKIRRPHISIVCNFTKPTPTKPSLLTLDEVKTLFHEFGHALHGLLSECRYRSLGGTNVFWDFVELPSQLMENWVSEKEGLDLFARHYETLQEIPLDLVNKLKKSASFQAGWVGLRQLQFGILDMKWHTTNPMDLPADIDQFETEAISETRLLPKIPNTNISCGFSHIFAGGYSAGYYSYKWAEVLDSDAFEYFKEKGLFNKEIGQLFKENILKRGGTEDPMILYKRFRGKEPDPNALLRREGLL